MPPEARAVHHISDGDLRDAPPVAEGFALLMNGGVGVFAAHNCEFERAFFGGGLIAWICTLKVARRLWPECPSHSNQCLRYWLELQVDGQLATPPHRAAPDAYVTALILQRALEQATVEQMIEWTTQPSLLPRVEFGKHRGQPWKDLPTDYLDWIVRKSELDADVKFTASHHLRRSRA
jgi:exodeoxyribonuclease X